MILFRADGNAQIGSGHIMRCLSIADAFKRKNIDCKFVLADKSFQPLIEDRGYSVHILETDYRNMDSEWDCLQKAIKIYCPELVIVDSYFVTKSYLQRLKDQVRLAYVDDLAAFAYPVDILINYNLNGTDHNYEKLYLDANVICPQLLLGITYAPLREMFRNIPKREQKEIVEDVLVSSGGSDPLHLALTIAKYVAKHKSAFNYHFLVGTVNEDYEKIKAVAANNQNIHVHHNVKDMKTLITSSDLVVSAAGSTMYEICACGVPAITYVLADNQIPGAEAFEKLGLAVNCGDLRDSANQITSAVINGSNNVELLNNAVIKIMENVELIANDFELRKKIASKMQALIDGCGAYRLVARLLNKNTIQ